MRLLPASPYLRVKPSLQFTHLPSSPPQNRFIYAVTGAGGYAVRGRDLRDQLWREFSLFPPAAVLVLPYGGLFWRQGFV